MKGLILRAARGLHVPSTWAVHPIDDAEARHNQFLDILTPGFPKSIPLVDRPVTIGDGAVAGAGLVATKEVAPSMRVAGNPARFIRHIQKVAG